MSIFKLDLDKETAKQLRAELFRPLVFSLIVGFVVGVGIALVAFAALGATVKDKAYAFSLSHADGWIIFTIFMAIFVVVTVIVYYRMKDDNKELMDDFLTPFRKELSGQWRVFWQDVHYENQNGIARLAPSITKDFCTFGIDRVGKLYIESEINRSEIFEDWKNRIEDISINSLSKRLCFYDEGHFTIKAGFMKDENEERKFDARFFVALDVNKKDDNNKVIEYGGRWYDLDGTFARLKEIVARQIHSDLPQDLHFPRSGEISYVKSPKKEPPSAD